MKVGLFIPCYVDQFYPQVGLAVVDVLQRFGLDVEFPTTQTCCGQPMSNTGCTEDTRPLAEMFLKIFAPYEVVVCPSGSCTAMIRYHYDEYLTGMDGFDELKQKTYELSEFLADVLNVKRVKGQFPHKVGIHQSCHGLRELRLAKSSELMIEPFSKARPLLESLDGIELTELDRADECCGFGGTFAVAEEAVSCMMGNDRIQDHQRNGTEVLTGVDMSCLMHMEGLMRRQKTQMRVMHFAEILAESGAVAT